MRFREELREAIEYRVEQIMDRYNLTQKESQELLARALMGVVVGEELTFQIEFYLDEKEEGGDNE